MLEHDERVGHLVEILRRPAMPLFHFNSRTGDTMLPDLEGEDLPDLDAAREVAMSSAREALVEAVRFGDTPPSSDSGLAGRKEKVRQARRWALFVSRTGTTCQATFRRSRAALTGSPTANKQEILPKLGLALDLLQTLQGRVPAQDVGANHGEAQAWKKDRSRGRLITWQFENRWKRKPRQRGRGNVCWKRRY